jgi:uracil-DNA glycosylase family 4
MSDPSPPDGEILLRQARQHLQSLRSAGVEWLPVAPPEAVRPPAQTAPASLFEASSSPDGLSLEQRRAALTVLAQEVAQCQRCPQLASTRTQTVFSAGPPGVEVCFIGEAPGGEEDAQGVPFVGPAGQLFNRILAACGLKREEVYICNALKCRPPGNRSPQAQELANCRGFLERQLELVRPKFICCLGGSAAQALLNTNQSLGRLRRQFHDYKGIPVLCTYHPAYLLPHRNPEKKRDVWEDMKLLLTRMGRPIPSTGSRTSPEH